MVARAFTVAFEGVEARVVEVQDEDGELVHFLAGPVVQPGTALHGHIDWDRRSG